MNRQPLKGINRQGLDAAFEAEEERKSSLILEARLLREQRQQDEAAAKFAEAAEIEERLSDICEAEGLREKSFKHRFSAASCWAQAGNFYQAITLCNDLLARSNLPDRLRQRIGGYVDTLRDRQAKGVAEILITDTGRGMTEDEIDMALKEFVGDSEGPGMGRAVARHIWQTYGGEILDIFTGESGITMVIQLPQVDSSLAVQIGACVAASKELIEKVDAYLSDCFDAAEPFEGETESVEDQRQTRKE